MSNRSVLIYVLNYIFLYNVAIVTPLNINIEPIAIYQESAPEKYWGKNKESTKTKNTDQKEYVTFRQRALPAPTLSIEVYQQKNEIIPMNAVNASKTQQRVSENIAL